MELLFAALGGALLGFIFHFALPGADTRGLVWLAGWGTSAAIVAWEVLTWLEWKSGAGWIWVVSLLAAALTVVAVARIGTLRRRAADKELLEALFRGSAA
ncbi:hypothetical protein GCM10025867_20890 [Frondihabitans sucicola]|uniref:Uncharacterized protein n=1 Tax=Frondihabitans sucicola TaxID=1268041 RepID=A0ABN6Y1G9_9MICO|nr:hypothetical protein [Frondihabitans sucicola]BDZ49848.1 hypothetical protein GCM10025867_20890 [Frondihabitans sucicola]